MKLTRADIWLTVTLLFTAALLGGVLFLAVPHGQVAVVTVDDVEVARLRMDTDTTVTVAEGYTVVVAEGKVRMETAPCPDLICVHTPPVSRTGETVVCLPGRVIITVEEE